MSILQFFRTREWILIRRLVLVGLIVFLGYRTWGSYLIAPLQSPNAARDIAITKVEFRPDLPGAKPAWIIGLRNNSRRFGYDQIKVQAKYLDKSGAMLQVDSMTLQQKLIPGQEEVIGTTDYRERPGASNGTMTVIDAAVLK
jgi:hypothetical protein